MPIARCPKCAGEMVTFIDTKKVSAIFKVWVDWGIIERLSWFFGEFEYDNGLRSRGYN